MEKYLVTYTTPIAFGREMGYPEEHSGIRSVENLFSLPHDATNVSYHRIEKLTEDEILVLKEASKKIKEDKKAEEKARQIAKHEAEIERLKNS